MITASELGGYFGESSGKHSASGGGQHNGEVIYDWSKYLEKKSLQSDIYPNIMFATRAWDACRAKTLCLRWLLSRWRSTVWCR